MKASTTSRWVRVYAALVGGMDFATGLALVAVPEFTLRHMGVAPPEVEAMTFVRFVGSFVGAVGLSYLLALRVNNAARLWTMLELTLPARAGAGVFTGVAVATGMLGHAWLIVAATDFTCAVIQAWLLGRGIAPHA